MKDYDKLGVAQELIGMLEGRVADVRSCGAVHADDMAETEQRLKKCCQLVRQKIELSQGAHRRDTGKQLIERVVHEFLKRHSAGASVYDIILLLQRIEHEVPSLGKDNELLEKVLGDYLKEVTEVREKGQIRFEHEQWNLWKHRLENIRRNPLSPEIIALLPVAQKPAIDDKLDQASDPVI